MQLDLGWYVFRRLPFPSIFSPVVIEANQTSGVTPKQGRRVGDTNSQGSRGKVGAVGYSSFAETSKSSRWKANMTETRPKRP